MKIILILKQKRTLLLLAISAILLGLGAAIFLFPQNSTPSINNVPDLQHDENTTSTDVLKLYRNEEWGFEFRYPENWSFHANTFGSPFSKFNLVGASPKENNHPDPIDPSILVNIVTPDFANRAFISLKNLGASTSVVMVAGVKGTKYEYEFEKIPQIGVDLPFGEYRMILGAKKQHEDVFNQILASFKFLNSVYKLEDILTPDEKISSSQIAPNNTYAFALTQKSSPILYFLRDDKNGPIVAVMDNLIFANLITKEKKEFDLYELVSKEIINPLRSILVQVQFSLYAGFLKWSSNSNEFWGAIYLISGADPPVNDSVSLFKINTKDWSIEKFALPGRFINSLGQQNLNLEKNAILFESVENDELVLYIYELTTKKKTTFVSYDNSIFSKYLPGEYGFVGYFHPWFLETESRQLNAKWLDSNTVSYIDFITRQEIVKKVE